MDKWPIDIRYGISLKDITPVTPREEVVLPERSAPDYIRIWQKKNPGKNAAYQAKWRQIRPERWAELNLPYNRRWQQKTNRIRQGLPAIGSSWLD